MTTLFYCSVSNVSCHDIIGVFKDIIAPTFQDEISTYVSPKYALHHLAGRITLYHALRACGYFKPSIDVWDLSKNKHGKPVLPIGPHFNISHDEACVVVALSENCPVGVDVEKITFKEISRYKARVFSDLEWHQIVSSKDHNAKFHQLWTQKEATMKADGRGISMGWKNVEVNDSISVLSDTGEVYYLHQFDCVPEHSICLALSVPAEPIVTRKIDILSRSIVAL